MVRNSLGRPRRDSCGQPKSSDLRITILIGASLQFGVLGFGGDEDRDVRIGVFPKGEEILVSVTGIGLVGLCRVGARYSELCQWREWRPFDWRE